MSMHATADTDTAPALASPPSSTRQTPMTPVLEKTPRPHRRYFLARFRRLFPSALLPTQQTTQHSSGAIVLAWPKHGSANEVAFDIQKRYETLDRRKRYSARVDRKQ